MSTDAVGEVGDLDSFEQYLLGFRAAVASRPRLVERIADIFLREKVVVVRFSDGRDVLIPLLLRPDGIVAHECVYAFPPRAAGT